MFIKTGDVSIVKIVKPEELTEEQKKELEKKKDKKN